MGSEDPGQVSLNFVSENAVEAQFQSVADSADQLNSNTISGSDTAIVLRSANSLTSQCLQDHVDLSDGDARVFLKEIGWDVTLKLPTPQDSRQRWMYKSPCINPHRSLTFYSLRTALEEHNRREKHSPPDSGKRVTVGLLKDIYRQASTVSKKYRWDTEEIFPGNKRFRLTTGENSGDSGGEVIHESDPAVQAAASRTSLPEPSTAGVNLHELNHQNNLSSHPNKKNQEDESTFNELKVVLSRDEARDFLRAAGWQLTLVMRKSATRSWYYKTPAEGNCKPVTFPSLLGALNEYNQRVRIHNTMGKEQKPTVYLKNEVGCSEADAYDVKSVRARITEKKGTNEPERNELPRPSNGQAQPSSSGVADVGLENIFSLPGQDTLPFHQLEQFTRKTKSSVDSQSAAIRTFGSFARDVVKDDREYVLEIHTLNFAKDQLRIHVENDQLLMKATYSCESVNGKLFMNNSVNLSSRLTLPEDAIPELVTATQVEPGILRLTIPRCLEAKPKIEITIG
ncbi:hypothetical protein R1flu_000489 [Riccia fluitans]|uniref:SHSP domain-containing protein n=1 Tax=Riccia fluitans TaxID=41844 RepID=A0ABD1Y4R6_9MARC